MNDGNQTFRKLQELLTLDVQDLSLFRVNWKNGAKKCLSVNGFCIFNSRSDGCINRRYRLESRRTHLYVQTINVTSRQL